MLCSISSFEIYLQRYEYAIHSHHFSPLKSLPSSLAPSLEAIAATGPTLINIAIDPFCGTESGSLQDHN